MTTSEKILRGLKLKDALVKNLPDSPEEATDDVMGNPNYLRQSSALINEALQKGYDVLQLANGDIVTTGTKIVVTTYAWDEERSKLVKRKTAMQGRRGRPRKSRVEEMDEDFEEAF
jgi:hypothetical protein